MIGGNGELQIVRFWSVNSATATGECLRYDCNDGSRWHDVGPFEVPQTGDCTGQRYGDCIIPD